MTPRGCLDTNILLYSISTAEQEERKRQIARDLIDQDGWGLSVQVLQEFYVQATRAGRAHPLPHCIAAGLIRTWLRFQIQDVTAPVMVAALAIGERHGLSYWDAAVISAAQAQGARKLYSEDMSTGR